MVFSGLVLALSLSAPWAPLPPGPEGLEPLVGGRCELRRLSLDEREAVEDARAHLEGALTDPAVRALLRERAPGVALDALAAPWASLFTYGGSSCPGALQRANAVTTEDQRFILVRRAYFEDADTRRLASTLAHEAAHVLGFQHPTDAAGYAASVPVVLGCVVARFPDVDAARAACGARLRTSVAPPSRPAPFARASRRGAARWTSSPAR